MYCTRDDLPSFSCLKFFWHGESFSAINWVRASLVMEGGAIGIVLISRTRERDSDMAVDFLIPALPTSRMYIFG